MFEGFFNKKEDEPAEEPQVIIDVPVAEAKAEGQKLEWTTELPNNMSWNDAQIRITELNAGLAEGEKPWRLPTKDELVAEFRKSKTSTGFRGIQHTGFRYTVYWSSATNQNEDESAYCVGMDNGHAKSYSKYSNSVFVRLVRDTA